MTLVDTSAWVEYLRATGSPTHGRLRDLIEEEAPLWTTDVVIMEVLAGARDDQHAIRLRQMLASCEFVPIVGLDDFEQAAALFRLCRRGGSTVRALTDCLVAAVAIRARIPVLHADRDFDALASHTALEIVAPADAEN